MRPLETHVVKFPNIQEVIEKLSMTSFKLEQDTQDTAQLNPVERLNSINKVWKTCKNKIGNPTLALDVGSGFGYGIVFLEGHNIKTIGIENIGKKIKQGQDLFKLVGINIQNVTKLDFSQHPAFLEGDITTLSNGVQVDLITLFYLSLQMVSQPGTFQTLQKLLKKHGTVLLSTNASIQEVKAFLGNSPILLSFTYEIIEVPDNFEKTAILLKLK
jgi:SAM-dependent methyltransferase